MRTYLSEEQVKLNLVGQTTAFIFKFFWHSTASSPTQWSKGSQIVQNENHSKLNKISINEKAVQNLSTFCMFF